ncbi:hypothetical protein [Methylobacterium sp. SyP6R]|uniref:hypothetical protein n=1 Tax=Methylobacterium sp. SyP6R TaxID=2718876 RepID=UPI001F275E3E|nr:hypothetical protein [Methylobacterium sp. SyP6R]MCF4130315.1 hypothetical protein [Methylobacterium sp. SyP6R]
MAFSLWRAVFLSDTTEEFKNKFADLNKFLISLISDNTVLYITDKNSRNWSFHYYLENANSRLRKIADGDLQLVDKKELDTPTKSDKEEWISAQKTLDLAIERLASNLNSSK